MIDTVLFDLDGTLLPMDQDVFIEKYMGLLAAKLAQYGYEPKRLVKAVWQGTGAMVKNDGSITNEAAFWEEFQQIFGPDVVKDMPVFEEFYATDFAEARKACGFSAAAAEVVELLKKKGADLVMATNPLFPAIATRQRIRWAGLEPEDFRLVTTYENTRFCKPNPEYYREVLAQAGKKPGQCLMVGNDVGEDMLPAASVGMKVFLLTDCIINKTGADIEKFPHGGFESLKKYLEGSL